MYILEEKDGSDSELLLYAMTLINKVSTGHLSPIELTTPLPINSSYLPSMFIMLFYQFGRYYIITML